MAHKECHDVGQWVSENVTQQVEQCVEQDCDWWCLCCNKWLCFLAWVVVVVVTWVVTTVCEIVGDVIDLAANIVRGLIDIVVGIFTLDWSRIVAGFGEIVGGVIAFVGELIPIALGLTFVGAFVDAGEAWALRRYVRRLLTSTYGESDPDGLQQMLTALGLSGGGGFGFRLEALARRSFIRSDFAPRGAATPALVGWVANGLDLKMLAGFTRPLWWDRGWPELVADGGGDISESDIDAYIAAGGQGEGVKQFSLFAMSTSDLRSRLDCADAHSSELGLIFRWTVEDTMLEQQNQVVVDRNAFPPVLPESPFDRIRSSADPAGARGEVAKPLSIAGFGFLDGTGMGISAHLADATILEPDDSGSTDFPGQGITGTDFRYRKPDIAFKYTAIHEIGHTFGLGHVDGLLRIMYTNADDAHKSIASGSSWWQYLTHGLEAGFILDEGKKAWDYIVANVDASRLETRAF